MSLDRFDDLLDEGVAPVYLTPEDGVLTVPDAQLLFSADFQRAGQDLLLVNDGAPTLRIPDYFVSQTPAAIFAPDGSQLSGAVVARLAGPIAPGQYAQAASARGGDPIGQVETIDGGATVQRADGTVETLELGMKIFQNDVVETANGASVSLTFADGTIFTLSSASRMIIDDLIYNPDGDSNSATFNLVQGSFVFIAGQVARTGEMEVNTPSATMGIRGTTVIARVQTENGVVTTEVTLTRDADGGLGRVELRSLDGELITVITATDSKWVVSTEEGGTFEVPRTVEDEANDALLIAQVFAALQSAAARIALGETFVTLPSRFPDSDGGPTDPSVPGSGIDVDPFDDPIITTPDPEPSGGGSDGGGGGGGGDEPPAELPPLTAQDVVVQGVEDAGEEGISGAIDVGEATQGLVFEITSGPENGTATLQNDGTFNYIPDANFNGTDGFNYRVTRTGGEVDEGRVVVEVAAVNDAPVLENSTAASPEDSPLIGQLSGTDVDGDPLTYTLVSGATNGLVTLQENGVYSYSPNLHFEGEDSFVVEVSDASGATDTATVSITVTPVNDAPVATTPAAQAEGALDEAAGNVAVSGQFTATDPDLGDTLTWTGSQQGSYGALVVEENGSWTYTLDPALADPLPAGQTAVETFTVTVSDTSGASDTETVTITVTGTNDTPELTTVTGGNAGAVTEDSEDLTTSGTLNASDVDGTDTLTWSNQGADQGTYGAIAINGDGSWTYTLDPALADSLGAGQEETETFTAQVDDGNGGVVTQDITITVTGSNDTPELGEGGDSGAVTEPGADVSGDLTTSGMLSASDVDGTDTLTWSNQGADQGTYGAIAINGDGSWTYTLDPALADSLGAGEVETETFTAQVDDGNGGVVPQDITITVTGSNDTPELGEGGDSGAVTEPGADVSGDLTTSGTLSASDVDGTDTLTWSNQGADQGTYGAIAINGDGSWTYTLDPALADSLGAGQEETETFTAQVDDGNGGVVTQDITITVTGSNDAPRIDVAASSVSGTVEEGAEDNTAGGTVVASDIDTDETVTFSVQGGGAGAYGILTINAATGAWLYTLDNAAADVLTEGQNIVETFTILASDGTESTQQLVSVTVEGTNDLPVITTNDVVETVQDTEVTGTLSATDPEGEAMAFYLISVADGATVTIQATGEFSYTPAAGFVGFTSFTYEVQDATGGQTQGTLAIAVESGGGGEGETNPVDVSINLTATADAPAGSLTIDVNEIAAPRVNVVFALDGSGSVSSADWAAVLANVQSALSALRATFGPSDTEVTVGFTVFSGSATFVDPFDLNDPSDPPAWQTELAALIQPGGLTNWTAALNRAETFLDEVESEAEDAPARGDGASNFVFFITDGSPTVAAAEWQAARASLLNLDGAGNPVPGAYTVAIDAFGIGSAFGGGTTALANLALLDTTDPATLAPGETTYTLLDEPGDLAAALTASPAFNPALVSLSVTLAVDGAAAVAIADETSDALLQTGIDYQLAFAAIDGIAGQLGAQNRFSVTADYDLDGDGAADLTLFSTEVLGRADSAQTLSGFDNDGADLLFGSDFDDSLDGLDGDDLLIGYGGNDTIIGGTGFDTVLAGDGDDILVVDSLREVGEVIDGGNGVDVLRFTDAGNVNLDVLDVLTLSNIEVIDMANGEANSLSLSLADVVDLSSSADTVLAGLLGETLGDSARIYGDGPWTDFFSLEDGTDGSWQERVGADVTDATGVNLVIFDYIPTGGGGALATVGVDEALLADPGIA